MRWIDADAGKYASIDGMDPRTAWLLDERLGLHDYMPSERLVSFIIRFDTDEGFKEFERLLENAHPLFVPSFYFGSPKRANAREYFTAMAPRSFFDDLALKQQYDELRKAPKHILLGLPLHEPSSPVWTLGKAPGDLLPPPPAESHEWPPDTVVIGIIDDGIAFAHQRFRDGKDSTRVQYFWQQDGVPEPGARTVDYGRELWKHSLGKHRGIDALLKESSQGGAVIDEEEVYRHSGLLDFTRPEHKGVGLRVAHGTHVLDLAAGYDPEEKIASRPIIAVQLPVATTADTSGAGLEPHVLDGIEYILNRAALLAGRGKSLPVVINFSYGTNAGPHDGSSPLERSMDRLIQERTEGPLRIVLPAGNANLARCHAELTFSGGERTAATRPEPQCLNWRLLPDDKTRSILEIWLPASDPEKEPRISLSIETPDGSKSHELSEGSKLALQGVEGEHVICDARYYCCVTRKPTSLKYIAFSKRVLIQISQCFQRLRNLMTQQYYTRLSVPGDDQGEAVQRGLFRIIVQPTERLPSTAKLGLERPVSPSGVWKVKLHDLAKGEAFTVQAWIERDDTAHGYPVRGRQSYFDHGCYQLFDSIGGELADDPPDAPCIVKRAGMISGIATGNETIVVGGYLRKEREPSGYSAGGSIARESGTRGPDAAMVSDNSRVHPGVLAAGSRSGSVVAMRGTSVAAPQVARIVAEQLAKAALAGTKATGSNPAVKPGSRAAIAKLARESGARPRSANARADEKPHPRAGAGLLDPPEPVRSWRKRYVED